MSNVSFTTATPYADLDWNQYVQCRPTYPESLKNIIYDYRRNRRETRWQRLVDIGGGVGVSSALFIPDFEVIQLLDPSPSNHQQARPFLANCVKNANVSTRLEFTEATAQKGHEYIQDADLAICAETAHFIDADQLVAAIAGMLRPGGTLAVYSYWMPIFPSQSVGLSDLFHEIITRTLGLCITLGDDATKSLFCETIARVSTGKSVLDSLPVPDEHFEDVLRIRINTEAERGMETFKKTFPVSFTPLESRVKESERRLVYDSRQDDQAKGWAFRADAKWLHGFLATMRPADLILDSEQYESIYGEWDRAFQQECPSGEVDTLWPVNIVLATRK